MNFLWPDRFRQTFAILPVILYAEDKILLDSARSAATEEVNSMNKSGNMHCSVGERLWKYKHDWKHIRTQRIPAPCTLKNTSATRL